MFGLTTPQVSDNGATLIDPVTGRALQRSTLSRADAEKTIKALLPVSGRVLACDAGRFIDDTSQITDWSITMVMARFDTESEAVDWVERLTTDTVSVAASIDNQGHWYIDCTGKGIDKANGARAFSNAVGIELSDLLVIGDGWNDIPMFEVAGTSIAMKGAPVKLLELSTYVTASLEDDGAAQAIEKYVLGSFSST
jgi:hydroxymethylpyrimidine pyrophosphatase-like HAD family hydrolase